MYTRNFASLFPQPDKSLREMVVDAFNQYFPALITGLYHPTIPRLTGNPVFGRALEMKNAESIANLFKEMAKLAATDPRGIVYSSIFIKPCWLVTRPSDIAQVLIHNAAKVRRGAIALPAIMGDNVLTLPGHKPSKPDDKPTPETLWWEQRKRLKDWIMNGSELAEIAPQMQKIIDDEYVAELKRNGNVAKLENFLVSLTMNVFAGTRLGANPIDKNQVDIISEALGHGFDVASYPMNAIWVRLHAATTYLREMIGYNDKFDVEHANLKDIIIQNFLKPQAEQLKLKDGLLKAYFDMHLDDAAAFDAAVSDTELYLLAGQETTERLIQFTLILLKQNPRVLEKLRDEIETKEPADGQWTRAKLGEMTYLMQIIIEVLRLFPPIPLIPRLTTEDIIIADIPLCRTLAEYRQAMAARDITKDIIIPAKTPITIMPWATHRLDSIYENPEQFNPERHTAESVSILKLETQNFCGFIPFGAGPRSCPGRDFAIQEAMIVICRIIKEFDYVTSLDNTTLNPHIRGTLKLQETTATFTPRN